MTLNSFEAGLTAVVAGASGAIGRAFLDILAQDPAVARIHAWSRRPLTDLPDKAVAAQVDLTDEATIEAAAGAIEPGSLRLGIVATGILHEENRVQPEKSLSALDGPAMDRVFAVNTIGPALAAKHLVPLMPREGKAVFAALSARVGSIGDNRLGGWYAYRASKAALNQILKTLSVEVGRRRKEAVILGLHPGTVDSALSEPFQRGVPDGKLFTPAFSAQSMLSVIDGTTAENSGLVYAWDGQQVPH